MLCKFFSFDLFSRLFRRCIAFQNLTNRGTNIDRFVGHQTETFGQSIHFSAQVQMFVDNAMSFIFNFAQAAFYPDTGISEILLGYRHIQFFSKIF